MMDKSWVHKSTTCKEYEEGVNAFLDHASIYGYVTEENFLRCPCINCKNFNCLDRDTICEHLICDGMLKSYTKWVHHGEKRATMTTILETRVESREGDGSESGDNDIGLDIDGMLSDIFPNVNQHKDGVGEGEDDTINDPIVAKFQKLLEQSKKDLYPGCEEQTMLSFVVEFWHLKCLGGWSNKTFTMLLGLLRRSFPEGCTLPENFTQCKKVISDLGLNYDKINACPNDCMLYWKENSKLQSCTVCGASRWNKVRSGKKKNTPKKILRYFPLIPRLQRLFMSSRVAKDMRWHEEGRTKDGGLRHVADSEAWKHFDKMNPAFAADLRNVRLGLASDGFNPFRTMSSKHSTWPVVVIPYNLPPWLCMKQPSLILSLLIPGPSGPGNNIDVYMRPLIEELKELWSEGVDTYDSFSKEMFKMKAGEECNTQLK